VNVLTKIERRKKRQKLRGKSVCRIIEMNVEVTSSGVLLKMEVGIRKGPWRRA